MMIKYDYSLLRGKIIEAFGNNKNFVKQLNKIGLKICAVTFYSRISNETEFRQHEIQKICVLLNIPIEQIGVYFFTLKYEFNS